MSRYLENGVQRLLEDGSKRYLESGPDFATITANINTNWVGGLPLPYSVKVLPDAPSGYWRLGEPAGTTATDLSGNGRDGTYTNAPTLGVPGLVGDADTAMQVSGVNNQGVDLGNSAALQLDGNFTVEAWVKTTSPGSGYRTVIAKQFAYGVFLLDGVLHVYEWNLAVSNNSGVNVADGQRHHIAVAFGASNEVGGSRIYVDGVPVGSAFTHLTQGHTQSCFIGYNSGTGQEIDAVLDEVAIYPVKLSAGQIAAHVAPGGGATGWTATAVAIATHLATITTSWGTWNATAIASVNPQKFASITTSWGTWTATALAGREVIGVIPTVWTTWNATAVVLVQKFATITTSWTSWSATAVPSVSPQKFGTITTSWTSWNATSVLSASPQKFATITTSWGTWTATGIALRGVPATVTTSWSSWNATSIATRLAYATITTSWGTWVATAQAQPIEHPAIVVTSWGTWTATANAGMFRLHDATIDSNWGGWTATAITQPDHPATIATSWGGGPAEAGFSPDDIPGLNLWLKADDLVGTVASWPNDGSVAADALVVGTPEPVVAGMTPSGLPAVRFAVDQGRIRMNGTGVHLEWTLVYVGRIIGSTGRVVTAIYFPANLLVGFWNGFQDVMYDNGFTAPNTQTPVVQTQWKLYSADGTDTPRVSRLFSDGVLMGSTSTGQGWSGTFSINGYDPVSPSETCECEVAAVCLYGRTLTDLERTQVEDHLRQKYISPEGLPAPVGGVGGWVATATATLSKPAVVTTDWGTWTATGLASRTTEGRVTENWGGWLATAVAFRETGVTITTSWGAWTATAQGTVIAEQIFASISSLWNGGGTAVATALVSHFGAIDTTWSTWTATAVAQPIQKNATVATNWGTWTATAVAPFIQRNAMVVTNWGGWNATAIVGIQRNASITSNWGIWTATAVSKVGHVAKVESNWSGGAAAFDPVTELTGMNTWLMGDLPLADGAVVDMWPDQSGFGRDLTVKIAGATAPTLKTNELAGHSVIRFNGVDNVLSASISGAYRHFFIVVKYNHAAFQNYDGLLAGLGGEYLLVGTNNETVFYSPIEPCVYHKNGVLHANREGPMGAWAYISYSSSVGWPTLSMSIGMDRQFADRCWDGDVAEVLCCNQVQSDAQRRLVDDYFGAKYFGLVLPGNAGWMAVATATINRPVSIATNWGGWTATAVTVPDHPAVGIGVWDTAVFTAVAGQTHPAIVSSHWGTWTATSTASPTKVGQGVIFTNWSSWSATAVGQRFTWVSIDTVWPTWSATALAVTGRAATITTDWGTWTAIAVAQPIQRNATITTTWPTGWVATAAVGLEHPAVVASNWGTWVATAQGAVGTGTLATIASNWGAWTATTASVLSHEATITTAWGTWSASADGVAVHVFNASIITNWSSWAAAGQATVDHPATISALWTTWSATAVAQPLFHPALIDTDWDGWTAFATPTVDVVSEATTHWGDWIAEAFAVTQRQAVIDTFYTATFTASADAFHPALALGSWEGWDAVADAFVVVHGVMINEADLLYLGDEKVDRVYLDGHVVWELV